jgi:hypothetical protein
VLGASIGNLLAAVHETCVSLTVAQRNQIFRHREIISMDYIAHESFIRTCCLDQYAPRPRLQLSARMQPEVEHCFELCQLLLEVQMLPYDSKHIVALLVQAHELACGSPWPMCAKIDVQLFEELCDLKTRGVWRRLCKLAVVPASINQEEWMIFL